METTTPLESEIIVNAVKTEPATEESVEKSEVPTVEVQTPKLEEKTDREASEPPAKKAKTEIPPPSHTPDLPAHNEPPVHEMVGGSSVRQYLNKHLTAHMLEGLKQVSRNKPEDPLRELGEFLIARSKELKEK